MDDAQVLYTEANNKIAQRTYEKNGWVKSDLIGRFDKDKKKEWYLYYNPKRINASELKPYKKLG